MYRVEAEINLKNSKGFEVIRRKALIKKNKNQGILTSPGFFFILLNNEIAFVVCFENYISIPF